MLVVLLLACSDTDTDTDHAEIVVDYVYEEQEVLTETWWCRDADAADAGATYAHTFDAQLAFGEASEGMELWVLFDPIYLEFYQYVYGYPAPAAQLASTIQTDGDGFVIGSCYWVNLDGFKGYMTAELLLLAPVTE